VFDGQPGAINVARGYGGILGSLAFTTVVARGCVHGGGAESTLWTAWLGLLMAYPLGCLIGALADWIVLESIRGKLAAELAAREAKDSASRSKIKP
jgi:branched-subunit amino acid ABC-type transport system permease component